MFLFYLSYLKYLQNHAKLEDSATQTKLMKPRSIAVNALVASSNNTNPLVVPRIEPTN